ncbi:MAG: hypothetical protein ACPLX8_00265 [Nanopusillaceae archaeon]
MSINKDSLDKIIEKNNINNKEFVHYIDRTLSLLYANTIKNLDKYKIQIAQNIEKYLNHGAKESASVLPSISKIDEEYAIGLYKSLHAINILRLYREENNKEFFIKLFEELIPKILNEEISSYHLDLTKEKIIKIGYEHEPKKIIPKNVMYDSINELIDNLTKNDDWKKLKNKEKAEKIVNELIKYVYSEYNKTMEKLIQFFG